MLKLPLFPLNLVLLPYENLPLHIFEPRYKQMVKNALEEDKPFGIILKQGKEVFYKGCGVKVTKVFKEYQNGEYDILVKGTELFDVVSTKMDGDTMIGEVKYIAIDNDIDKIHFQELQDTYLKVLLRFGVNTDLEVHMSKKISYEFLEGIQLPITVKKDILEINKESERLLFINKIFQNILKSDIQSDNNQKPEA